MLHACNEQVQGRLGTALLGNRTSWKTESREYVGHIYIYKTGLRYCNETLHAVTTGFIYIYLCLCVCVRVRACVRARKSTQSQQ